MEFLDARKKLRECCDMFFWEIDDFKQWNENFMQAATVLSNKKDGIPDLVYALVRLPSNLSIVLSIIPLLRNIGKIVTPWLIAMLEDIENGDFCKLVRKHAQSRYEEFINNTKLTIRSGESQGLKLPSPSLFLNYENYEVEVEKICQSARERILFALEEITGKKFLFNKVYRYNEWWKQNE